VSGLGTVSGSRKPARRSWLVSYLVTGVLISL